MRKLILPFSLFSLLFCAGCGSSINAGFGNSTIGNFSNSSLSGQYAYQVTGYDINSALFFREAGVFTADGKGNISAGEDDIAEQGSVTSNSTSGTYSVTADGTGLITLNFGTSGGGISFAITDVSATKVYLSVNAVASAAPVNGSGFAVQQNTSAIATVPTGTFVFTQHNLGSASQGSSSSVGAFTVTGGAVSGNEDVNRSGALNALTINSGLFNTPDASGRGAGTFVDSLGVTSGFIYYVVDSGHLLFLANPSASNGTAASGIGLGQAVAQSGSFSTATFSGGYAFNSRADDAFGVDGINTVGSFTAGGNGTISAGLLDSDQDGVPVSSVAFTGAYTIAGNGRAVVTINPTGGTSYQQIFWMVSGSQAFFLTSDATKEEDGVATAQQLSSLATSSLNGQYGLVMGGFTSAGAFDRVGTLHWDGSGKLSLNEFANSDGSGQTPGLLSGTYSVTDASNGRVTGSISNVSSNFVFYMISDTDGYVLQNDASAAVSGVMSKQ